MVYIIQEGMTGRVKIGYTDRIGDRMRSLQTGNSDNLRIVCKIFDAGQNIEKELHTSLAKYRINGEWFEPVPQIRERAAQLVKDKGLKCKWSGGIHWNTDELTVDDVLTYERIKHKKEMNALKRDMKTLREWMGTLNAEVKELKEWKKELTKYKID